MKSHPLEFKLKKEGFLNIAGIDEAGRGPWAGPLVAAAVILPKNVKLPGLNDSKKMASNKREMIFSYIIKRAVVGIGVVSHKVVDKKGLTSAQIMAYQKAISNLSRQPDCLLIDGIGQYKFKIPYKTVKKGDSKVRSIAAASIVAKVVRDTIMDSYSNKYPRYGFSMHKGYGTRQHHRNLLKYGVCAIHRRSFLPVKEILYGKKTA